MPKEEFRVLSDDNEHDRFSRHDLRWSFLKGVYVGIGAAGAIAGFVLLVIQTVLQWLK